MMRSFFKGIVKSTIISLRIRNYGLLNDYKIGVFHNKFNFFQMKEISNTNQKAIFYESKNPKELEAMLTTNLPIILEFYSKYNKLDPFLHA